MWSPRVRIVAVRLSVWELYDLTHLYLTVINRLIIVNSEDGSPLLTMHKCIKGQTKYCSRSLQTETPCDQDPSRVRGKSGPTNAVKYDAPCVSKLFTNAFSYFVPTHVRYLALVLVLPTITSILVFHRLLNLNINLLSISLAVVM